MWRWVREKVRDKGYFFRVYSVNGENFSLSFARSLLPPHVSQPKFFFFLIFIFFVCILSCCLWNRRRGKNIAKLILSLFHSLYCSLARKAQNEKKDYNQKGIFGGGRRLWESVSLECVLRDSLRCMWWFS